MARSLRIAAVLLLLPAQGVDVASAHDFDCEAALDNWQEAWSDAKIAWCCKAKGLGCATEPFNCEAGVENFEEEWPKVKQTWCCQYKSVGCPLQAADPWDCGDRRADWERSWPEEKKHWCWKHEVLMRLKHGAQGEHRPMTYDCVAGFSSWRTEWSPGKKQWCCQYHKLGCSEDPFECDEGLDNWQAGWSPKKKAWCCRHKSKGCSGPSPAPTPLPFDCAAGVSNWAGGWSPAKKAFCCQQQGEGCHPEEMFYKRLFTLPAGLSRETAAARSSDGATAAVLSFLVSLGVAAAVVRSCQRSAVVRREAASARLPRDAERIEEEAFLE